MTPDYADGYLAGLQDALTRAENWASLGSGAVCRQLSAMLRDKSRELGRGRDDAVTLVDLEPDTSDIPETTADAFERMHMFVQHGQDQRRCLRCKRVYDNGDEIPHCDGDGE